MKTCTSCAKELPDAAMHCVFCGAKQPALPAPPAGANAKTVMGWQASDLLKEAGINPAAPPPAAPPPAAPPPAAPPPRAPSSPGDLGSMQTLAATGNSAGNIGVMQTLAAPPNPSPASAAATLPGPQTPSAAAAKTMFAAQAPSIPAPGAMPPGPGAAAFPPSPTLPAPSAFGPPSGPGAAAFPPSPTLPAPSAFGPPSGPGAAAFPPSPTLPAPSAFGGPAPSPAASAATMFAAPAPSIPQAGPLPGAGMPPQPGFGGPQPGFGGPLPGAGMPPQPGFGGPQPGFGGPQPGFGGPQPGFGGPQPGFGGPQPGFGGPQPGFGGPQPGFGGPIPGAGMPPSGGPIPAAGSSAPMMPPYLASRTAARAGAPREPFSDGLSLVLIIFGALLLVAFAAPLALKPSVVFRWDLLSSGASASVKFDHMYLAAAGVLALVFGLVPLATVPRGLLAAVLGLTPLAFHVVLKLKGKFEWQELAQFVGMLTLVSGLLLRQEYRSQLLPRLLVTIGAVAVLATYLVPVGGDPPIKFLIDVIGKAEGKAKLSAILALYPFFLALLSLLAWLPAPSSAGAKVFAWLLIVAAVVVSYTDLMIAGHIGAVVKANLNEALLSGWVAAAWLAFVGYGVATVLGKNLEHA